MRQFQFRLQTLLDVRIQREEQAQQAYAQQEQAVAKLKIEREQLIESIRRQSERLVFPADEPLRIEAARQDRRQLDHLEQSRVKKEKQIEEQTREADRLRKELVERTREREMVEKLKDRDFAQWQKEMARLDQVQLDEISSIAFNRRRRQGGEVRTYILLGIMLILLFALLYLTGTVSGRQWMDRMQRNLMSFHMPGVSKSDTQVGTAGGVGSATGDGDMLMDEEGGGIALESVRIEKERLERWEQKLRQQEQRVQLEIVALAEMRDDLASMQDSIDQQKKELEDLQGKMNSDAENERQERLDKLAKLFTDSKAKVAAKLLMDRDIETTVEIIQRMKERDLIKIVEEMNKIPAQGNQPSGADRAQELLDLFAEKALEKKAQP